MRLPTALSNVNTVSKVKSYILETMLELKKFSEYGNYIPLNKTNYLFPLFHCPINGTRVKQEPI